MNFYNKLDQTFLTSFSSLVECLWVRQGADPRLEHQKGASLGNALA